MEEVEKRMTDFIRVFDGVGTQSFCDKVLNHFKNIQTINRSEIDGVSPLDTDNEIYFLQHEKDDTLLSFNSEIMGEFVQLLNPPFHIYKKENSILERSNNYALNTDVKLQRTVPGKGYHVWHCESADLASARRIILFFMYLNDCEEGGETEFLYQHRRIIPKRGRLVFAPAYWTHIHRGNPPLKSEKYMINGWIEFIR